MTWNRPSGFAAFWDAVDNDLATVVPNVQLAADVRPPADGVRVHRLTFDSLDGVTVGGWFTAPDRDGPHPGLVIFPGYKSDPMPAVGWARRGYATFTLAHRGKLGATHPFNPGYPGMLTHGITDPSTYAYRGVYADCMRTLEVLSERAEVRGPCAVYGYSQGGPLSLFATARRVSHVGAVVAGAPFLTAFAYSVLAARTYPYHEIAEYLAQHPTERDTVFATLSYFDALHAIEDVTAPLLLFRAGADEVCPPYSTTLLRQAAPPGTLWREYKESGHDATGVRAQADAAAFFAEVLGEPDPVTQAPAPAVTPLTDTTRPQLPQLVQAARQSIASAKVRTDDRSWKHPAAAATRFVTVTTNDGARAGAYVAVPHDQANRQAGVIVEFSPYASVVSLPHPEDRERHTMITVAHRGQRGLGFAEPWMLPGVFDSADDPLERFAQLVADHVQLVETLLPDVHTNGSPVIGVGPDWLLTVAALTGVFTHVEVDSFWFTNLGADGAEFEYPRRELHEQLTAGRATTEALRWCDPVWWASQVTCDLLVVCADTAVGRQRAQRLTEAHAGSHAVHVSDARSALESEWRDHRRSALLGVKPAQRWQAARSGVRV